MVHHVAPDDTAALAVGRRYLSYLPANAWTRPPIRDGPDAGERSLDSLLDVIPPNSREPYDMHAVLDRLVDAGSWFEVQAVHGRSILTGLARLGRQPVVLSGSASERAGILRAGARMFAAQRRCRVPKLHVTVRKAFGFGSSVMGMNAFDDQTVSLAFPGVTLGGIPAAVGGATAREDDDTRRALVENEAAGPWRLAGSATYDEVIDPRELRTALLAGLRTAGARLTGPVAPVERVGYLP